MQPDPEFDPLADEKEEFAAWCEDFNAVSDSETLLRKLANCRDHLPPALC